MNKRRHHHVWQHYLKPWEVDRKITCLSSGKIFQTATINVAVDRDFYALKKLNDADIRFAKALISGAKSEKARHNQLNFLEQLTIPTELEGISSDIDNEIHNFRLNILEERHTTIEHSFMPLLKRAINLDIGFYLHDEESIPFIHYLCTQNMRTKGVQERLLAVNAQAGMPDISRIWPILALTFAENVGASLYAERHRRKLVLVQNTTDVPFITGDQPVTNLLALTDDAPECLAIYYPISPRLALILNEIDQNLPISTTTITTDQVRGLNAKIALGCHSQLFGTSEDALRRAQQDPAWTP